MKEAHTAKITQRKVNNLTKLGNMRLFSINIALILIVAMLFRWFSIF